jgi:hypothetical protein
MWLKTGGKRQEEYGNREKGTGYTHSPCMVLRGWCVGVNEVFAYHRNHPDREA